MVLSSTRSAHGLIAAALSAAAALILAGAGSAGPRIPSTDTGVRLLLIGLDGADWQIAGPLMEAGRLPNLARLRSQGAWGHLRSTTPMLSPLLWTSIATGKTPGEHGIIDFLVRDPRTGAMVPITSRFRKVRALWNIYSDAGRTADFIAWWATWPAETINGHIVSDRMAYSTFGYSASASDTVGLVSPPEFMNVAAALRVSEAEITLQDLNQFAPVTAAELAAAREKAKGDPTQAYADPLNHLTRILASTRTYHAAALKLLQGRRPDILSIYYQGIDEVSHRFAHYVPPRLPWVDAALFEKYKDVVQRFYEYQDALIGELLTAAGEGVTTVVVSDHGFLNGSHRPDFPPDVELKPGAWHRLHGILLMAGPPIRAGALQPATLYDVTPTLLYLSGLPVPEDMAGRPIFEAVAPGFRSKFRMATVKTYEDPNRAHAGTEGERSAPAADIDEEILAKLRALGYGSSGEISPRPRAGEGDAPATLTNMYNTAVLQRNDGDLVRSEATLRTILRRLPDHADSHSLLSEILEEGGRPEEALAEARTALELQSEPYESVVERYVRLSRRLGSLEEAGSFLAGYAKIRPARDEPWLGLGLVQGMTGDAEAADASFLRALELDPRSTSAVKELYKSYTHGGRPRGLLGRIERSAAAHPSSAAHLTLLGMIRATDRDYVRAEADFRSAIQSEPERDTALAGLGDVLMKTGRLDEARRILEEAVALRGDNVSVRTALGRLYAQTGSLEEATRQMEAALRLDPASGSAHAQIGMILAAREQFEPALKHLERALELDPGLHEVRLQLALLYHDVKKFAECESELKKAIEGRPNDPEAYRLLVGLYEEMGRREEAERVQGRLRQITGGP